jgi:hypothetical protein
MNNTHTSEKKIMLLTLSSEKTATMHIQDEDKWNIEADTGKKNRCEEYAENNYTYTCIN